MLLKDFIKDSTAALQGLYPAEEAGTMVRILASEHLGVTSYAHILDPTLQIPEASLPWLQEAMRRLSEGEPLQYVLGSAEFCSFRFRVTPAVLIPRPETEELLMKAAAATRSVKESPAKVLDLCTGSGCIAWSIALSVPGSEVTAVDISREALDVAAGQEFSDILRERHARAPHFLLEDVLGECSSLDGLRFDVIVSNPPYVMDSQKAQMRPNVLDHEPGLAHFVSDDDPLIFYRAVSRLAMRLLSEGGHGFVEINDLLGPQTRDLFVQAGFHGVSLMQDFYGKDRIIEFVK